MLKPLRCDETQNFSIQIRYRRWSSIPGYRMIFPIADLR